MEFKALRVYPYHLIDIFSSGMAGRDSGMMPFEQLCHRGAKNFAASQNNRSCSFNFNSCSKKKKL